MKTMTYRPDIDGLRAIAVLLVVIYHAFPELLPGGFIGVDIFFVISGFLISGILFKNCAQNQFSLSEFYARRIRRIFPSLIAMLSVCFVAGWFLLFADEFNQLGKHSFKAAFFVLNFSLASKHGYFETDALFKPLLHLWSLSIEEQFYIFWPIVVAGLWKYNKKLLPAVTLFLLIVSFFINIHLVGDNQTHAFYWPQARIWELLIGSLLAYTQTRYSQFKKPSWLALLGVCLIGVAASQANESIAFPGWWALLPTLGAAAILFADPKTWLNQTLLSSRLMVGIGLISYPLYLWHWPILSFLRILYGKNLSLSLALAAIIASFFLAFISYAYIEKNIRFSRKRFVVPSLVLCMLALSAVGLAGRHDKIPMRLTNEQTNEIVSAVSDTKFPAPSNFRKSKDFVAYTMPGKKPYSVLILGDSHAEHYWSRLNKRMLDQHNNTPSIIFATYGACPPFPGVNRLNTEFSCAPFSAFALQQAERSDVKTVVFSAWWEMYFGLAYQNSDLKANLYAIDDPNKTIIRLETPEAEQLFHSFEETLAQLHAQGKKIFIILSNPTSPDFRPQNMVSRLTLASTAIDRIDREAFVHHITPVTARLRAIATRTGATLIDPVPFLCTKTACPTRTPAGRPVYKDDNHLRPFYAVEKATYIDKILQ